MKEIVSPIFVLRQTNIIHEWMLSHSGEGLKPSALTYVNLSVRGKILISFRRCESSEIECLPIAPVRGSIQRLPNVLPRSVRRYVARFGIGLSAIRNNRVLFVPI